MKPVSPLSVLAAAAGSAPTSTTNPVPPLLVPQCSSSSVGSAVPKDGEEEVLAGSVYKVPSASSRMPRKEIWDTEEVLFKTGNEQTQKTLDLIDSTLSEIDQLWDQSYQMIKQYHDQSAAIKQTAEGQNVSLNLSGGAIALSVTLTTLLEGNQ